jgi:hypothetical protein
LANHGRNGARQIRDAALEERRRNSGILTGAREFVTECPNRLVRGFDRGTMSKDDQGGH